jgi:2-phospho-L-lactate/phosphoenolpyruvate guanylyltransferase
VDAGLLPIKSPARAKQRLTEGLTDAFHGALIQALIDDAFIFCSRASAIKWWVISDDEVVRSRARSEGLEAVTDEGSGLNEALRAGIKVAERQGAQSILVVPGDVPLAQPDDAEDILDTGAFSEVVVVPSTDGGTNALYFDLPTEMEPRFGPDSLRVHAEEAERLGLRCSILELPRLAVDLDTPEDARLLLDTGGAGSRTLEVLARYFA